MSTASNPYRGFRFPAEIISEAGTVKSTVAGRQMKRFKSPRQVQRFLPIHDPIANLFHLRHDHRPASDYRAARAQAFATWAEVAGAQLAA